MEHAHEEWPGWAQEAAASGTHWTLCSYVIQKIYPSRGRVQVSVGTLIVCIRLGACSPKHIVCLMQP
jgi:hypothetical protein